MPYEATVESLRVASYDAGRARNAPRPIIAFLLEMLIAFVVFVFVGHACAEYSFVTKSTKIVRSGVLNSTPVDPCANRCQRHNLGSKSRIYGAAALRSAVGLMILKPGLS